MKKTKSALTAHPPKHLNDRDPWMLAEDIPDVDFLFSQIFISAFANDLEKTVGRNYQKILGIFNGCNIKFYYGAKDSDDFAKHILSLIVNRPAFGARINKEIRRYSSELKSLATSIDSTRLAGLSSKQLADLFLELDKLHATLYSWGWLPNAVDMFHGNFTNYLKKRLEEKIAADQANGALVALSVHQEKSVIDQEQDSFLNLVALKQARRGAEFEKNLKRHIAKYFYLKHLWLGRDGIYNEAYYLAEIKKFVASGQKASQVLRQKAKQRRDNLRKQSALIKKLKISGKLLKIFSVYAEFSVTKVFRRDAQLLWAYKMDFIFAELSKRLRLPVMYIRFMFPGEIIKALQAGYVDKKMSIELKARTRACVYYAEKNIDLLFIGPAVKKWEKLVAQKIDSTVREIRGQAACLGRARGTVKIINSIKDMKKMNQGDILVSIATNPDIVPAMKKAAAIITEQGGITSHAAIVSREFNTPCIIGTKIATRVLKDGDLVEVDAEKGIVRII
ncbi:MAG: PEP-utilizing enzyme [Candidatus Falkowbacteria bacterium]|nr:PEP-utilizing enzyme [Candidatus Falkowbacteria bacterium]